jgi:hypothetical protein
MTTCRKRHAAAEPARKELQSRDPILPWAVAGRHDQLPRELADLLHIDDPLIQPLIEKLARDLARLSRIPGAEAALLRLGLAERALEPKRATLTTNAATIWCGSPAQADDLAEALHTSPEDDAKSIEEGHRDAEMTTRALRILKRGGPRCYERALDVLHESTVELWGDALQEDADLDDEEDVCWRPDAEALKRFLEAEIIPLTKDGLQAVKNRPAIREQAIGEAIDPARLLPLQSYESKILDEIERTIALIGKFQVLRQGSGPSFPTTCHPEPNSPETSAGR